MPPVLLYFSDFLSLSEKQVHSTSAGFLTTLELASQISGKPMDSVRGHGMEHSDSERMAICSFLDKGSLGKEFFVII